MTKPFLFPKTLPLVSLKNTVVFPKSILSVYVNEAGAGQAVKSAFKSNKLIFLSCLEDPDRDSQRVYRTGCVSFIMRMKEMEGGSVKVLVQGMERAEMESLNQGQACLRRLSPCDTASALSSNAKLAFQEIKKALKPLSQMKSCVSRELLLVLDSIEDPGCFCDMLTNNMDLQPKDLQKILESVDTEDRVLLTQKIVQEELEIFRLRGRLDNMIKTDIPKPALPSQDNFRSRPGFAGKREEIRELRQRFSSKKLPEKVKKESLKQLGRLEKMHNESSEASLLRGYLDWILDLPWNDVSHDNTDLVNAQKILDEDHFELKKAKERILEFLAVGQLRPHSMKGPVLCFAGPPGVGKTSLGKSIARSMGRSYHRICLGGVRDEAEIRGHRKTYVGAMPGKIIQALKICGTKNPVIVLDEIDKMCSDFRGDPGSALLEVLDPEQNHSFRDHYLNLDFDLSQVFFIATANLPHKIPQALKDRLEVISISGYTAEEKKHIARRHLISKELKNSGLPKDHIDFDEGALDSLILSYTREAGLRDLRRQLASLCRKTAKKFVMGNKKKLKINRESLENMLGSPRFFHEGPARESRVGIANGLAWTEAGGEILQVEAIKIKGKKGGLTLTGKLGDVMRESARAALSYVKSYIPLLDVDLDEEWFERNEIHIHLPGGAVPKDGPSAGIALASALLSLITDIPLKNTCAMTGEITLSGRVLPVGGVKEKVLAAFNNGIKTVILPEKNKKDLEEIPKEIRSGMHFVPVSGLKDVFSEVLLEAPGAEKTDTKEYPADIRGVA